MPYADEETLRERYHEAGQSLREIADDLDCHYTTVHQYMAEYGIDRREANYSPETADHATFTTHTAGYELWVDASKTVLVHRLVAVAHAGFDAVCDGIVHHENGVKWDNRPSNLTVVDSQREHARVHNRPTVADDQLTLSEIYRVD
ncbi:MAG: HNH endonuclease [Halorientalis sp.]